MSIRRTIARNTSRKAEDGLVQEKVKSHLEVVANHLEEVASEVDTVKINSEEDHLTNSIMVVEIKLEVSLATSIRNQHLKRHHLSIASEPRKVLEEVRANELDPMMIIQKLNQKVEAEVELKSKRLQNELM